MQSNVIDPYQRVIFESDTEGSDALEDSEIAYLMIVKSLKEHTNIRGAFLCQIKSLITDATDVSEQIKILREGKKFKLLPCKSYGLDDFFVMSEAQYSQDLHFYSESYINQDFSSAMTKFTNFIKNSSNISVYQKELCRFNINNNISREDENHLNQDEINLILGAGFLSLRRDSSSSLSDGDDICYNISHPKLGIIINAMQDARKSILSYIRKRTFKEVGMDELLLIVGDRVSSSSSSSSLDNNKKKRKRVPTSNNAQQLQLLESNLRAACGSVLGVRYVLYGLEGDGQVQRIETPSGKIVIRLAPSTSDD